MQDVRKNRADKAAALQMTMRNLINRQENSFIECNTYISNSKQVRKKKTKLTDYICCIVAISNSIELFNPKPH
jgi:hypothetical protein